MIERLKLVMSVKNLTSAQLAEKIGVQRSGISHILSGRNKPSLDFILKILETYPELNDSWILRGDGQMLKKDTNQPELFSRPTKIEDPLLEVKDEEPAVYGAVVQDIPLKNDDIKKEVIPEKTVELQDSIPSKMLNEALTDKSEKRLVKLIALYDDDSFKVYHSE